MDTQRSLHPAHTQGEGTVQGPENQDWERSRDHLEAAYHTVLLFDSNNKRSKNLKNVL